MLLLFVYLGLALVISFLCSIMEAVLLSTPVSYYKVLEEKGKKSATKILKLKKEIDKPLSAILSLNTVAHTIGAAGVGVQATIVFGEAYFGIVSVILTLLILFLTEIIPKTIGAKYWRKLAIIAGNMIRVTIFATYPLVLISIFITKYISSGLKSKSTSREEISALAKIGFEEGVFIEKESKIIHNLIMLKHISVSEVMTPRVVVAVANEEMLLRDYVVKKALVKFSRIPIFSVNMDSITGYVFRQTVYEKIVESKYELKLKDIKRKIVVVDVNFNLFALWEKLLESKEHIALVVDEFGGMAGIVTMEDIIETLLGFEIIDEKDTIADMQEFARNKWRLKLADINSAKE